MCTSTPLDKSLWMGSTSAVVHKEWNYMGTQDTMPEITQGLRPRQPHKVLMLQLALGVGGSGVRLVQG